MILLDSLYINNSGGRVLLDYLVKKIEREQLDVYYLFDTRLVGSYNSIPKYRKLFLKATVLQRLKFYWYNKKKFQKILCFGNVPPFLRVRAEIFVYFHQLLFLDVPQTIEFKEKIFLKIKSTLIYFCKSYVTQWIVQSEVVKINLSNKFRIPLTKILVMPFYPSFKRSKKTKRNYNNYLYVSNGNPYKNHIRLIEAFILFSNEFKHCKLHLTVSEDFIQINELIKPYNQSIITNHGILERNKLSELYKMVEYLIYPSLAESLGLGLLEGLENGCKIIGADLPYTYAVCEPSLTFNPYDVGSIYRALKISQIEELKYPVQKSFNCINELINLFR
jgi:glycosyltransferase involved in cell wall biosynthesis